MKAGSALGWLLFFFYSTWFAALQGWLGAPSVFGEWAPDLGLLLLFSWAARLDHVQGTLAAALVVVGRAGFGAASPAALLAGTLSAYGLFALLRSFLTVDRPFPRAVLCGVGVWILGRILLASRSLALAAEDPAARLADLRLWPAALTTAFACALIGPLCLGLPGLTPLATRRRP